VERPKNQSEDGSKPDCGDMCLNDLKHCDHGKGVITTFPSKIRKVMQDKKDEPVRMEFNDLDKSELQKCGCIGPETNIDKWDSKLL